MYLNVDEVDTAVQNLATAYPALCTLITLPNTTFEGRTTHALRLGAGAAGSRDCVTIIGGVHAREWGSPEILVDLAADLLEAFSTNASLTYGGKSFTAAQIQTLLGGLHLVVYPLVNPDGRHYSQTVDDPTEQFAGWRRNRNTTQSGGNPDCIGVDVNRNYDFLFDFATAFSPVSLASTYTSADPCNTNQVYHGPSAFSEPETQNVKWLLDANPRTRWFFDVHSFSEDILFSWGDDDDQSTTPAMNFQNHAFDGTRGNPSDAAYSEFIHGDDKSVAVALATRFHDGLQAVRGKDYTVKSSFQLYPTAGASDDYAYSRHIIDPSKGKIYAFVIEWGQEFHPAWTEMANIIQDVDAGLIEFCLAAPCGAGQTAIWLETPALVFEAVPAGVETTRAAVFSVQTCGAVDLNVTGPMVTSGPGAFGLPLGNGSLPAAPSAQERDVRIWVSFTGTSADDTTTGTMTVHCPQTMQDFVIPITAHTIAAPKVASMLVLDRSGSMDDPSGIPGQKRIDVLHAAAPGFVDLLTDNDGIGIVSFDQDAHPVMGVETAGAVGNPAGGRKHATDAIAAHSTNPAGTTSIGDGVELAHDTLAPLAGYDSTAIVVFTDGEENTYKLLADLPAGLIDDRVFAIGLGTADEVNPVALNALVDATGGYLLLTDDLGTDDQFRLAKYFVQIVAGVTNAEVVVDPQGVVLPGMEVRVPFDLVESDYGADAIVLSPFPSALRFQLETPAGVRIDHTALGGVAGVQFSGNPQLAFYRLSLPVIAHGAAAARGRWNVVLSTGKAQPDTFVAGAGRGVPYSVVVHARSALTMNVHLAQPSYVAPTTFHLRAVLTEIGLPLDHRAHVRAEVHRPDGTSTVVALAETEPGVFEATTPAPLNGVYPVRFRATGKSLRGFPFSREQTRTGMAWRGGDAPPPRTPPGNHELCDLLRCLLSDKGIRGWLDAQKIDPQTLTRCIERSCPKPA